MANNFVKEYLKIINEEVVDAADMAKRIENIRTQLKDIKADIEKDFEQALEIHGDVCKEAYTEILKNVDNAIKELQYPFGFYNDADDAKDIKAVEE